MSTAQFPPSPRATVGGFFYLPRMLEKIRLHARGELHSDYHANLGLGMDARLCRFLQVDYAAIQALVNADQSDEDVLAWCESQGRRLVAEDAVVWNGFVSKRGWNDEASLLLAKYKADAGLAERADIVTFFDLFDAEEGRS